MRGRQKFWLLELGFKSTSTIICDATNKTGKMRVSQSEQHSKSLHRPPAVFHDMDILELDNSDPASGRNVLS